MDAVREAVATALADAGLIDVDIVNLVDVSSVTITDGVTNGVDELVGRTITAHPKWFRGWDGLSAEEFADREREMRERVQRVARGEDEPRLPEILMHDLSETEEGALERYARGRANASDVALLKIVAKRQKDLK